MYEDVRISEFKFKEVSFDEKITYFYHDILYKNRVPLFFNIKGDWFIYNLVDIYNTKLKFLILFC